MFRSKGHSASGGVPWEWAHSSCLVRLQKRGQSFAGFAVQADWIRPGLPLLGMHFSPFCGASQQSSEFVVPFDASRDKHQLASLPPLADGNDLR